MWQVIAVGVAALVAIALMIRSLRPKYYFFIRHGQTILNATRVRQSSEGGLTESGKGQAERMGQFLVPFRIRRLYVSPYERTRETAAIVNKYLRCPITYSQLLVERRNPKEIIGKSMDDPDVHRISDLVDMTYHDDDYRYSDEENFIDLRRRAAKALRYLRRRHGHRVGVVTHGNFLKMLLAYMLYRKDLHAPDWVKLSFFSPADNGGLTLCIYRPWRRFGRTRGWEILSYNITIPTEHSDAMGHGIMNLRDLQSR